MNNMQNGSVRTFQKYIQSHTYTGLAKIFVRKNGPNDFTLVFQYLDQPYYNFSASSLPSRVWTDPRMAWVHQSRNIVRFMTRDALVSPNTPRRARNV